MKPNFYKQYDYRWSGYTIRGASIGRNGCGPTSIANVVSALVNSRITPKDTFRWMANNGYIDPVNGSYWNGITAALKHFGITKFKVTSSSASAKKTLKNNHWLIGVVVRSRWTSGGHYITLYDLTSSERVLVSDSASNSDYRQKQGTWREYRSAERMQWIDIDPKDYKKSSTTKTKSSKKYVLYVSDAKANVRSGRGKTKPVVGKLKRGTKLTLCDYKNGWYKIKTGKFKNKFINEKVLSKYQPYVAIFKTLYKMNVRNGYSTNGTSIIRTIGKGSKIKSSKKKGNWIYVPGLKGWVCIKKAKKTFLKKVK